MPKPNFSNWLTKQQAADAIGVSTKTVETLAKEKRLQQAYRKRTETGAKIRVFNPDDVAALRKERNPDAEPFVLQAQMPVTSLLAPASPAGLRSPVFDQVLQAIAAAARSNQSEVRIVDRLYLSIIDASQYSGLPQSHLRRLIAVKKLPALKTGSGWRIRRKDLDKI
jgi:excisionase family DNA binding protein